MNASFGSHLNISSVVSLNTPEYTCLSILVRLRKKCVISQAFCVLYYDKVRLNVPIEIVIVPGIIYGFISTVYLLLILI